jgi:hypothetical protein
MPSIAFVVLIICLGVGLIPVLLLRRKIFGRAQDYFVSSDHTPTGVIRNSSIAYAVKMAAFGPLFAWGAAGDFWPAIIFAVALGLGLYLLYALRRPILAFLGDALRRDRSVTVHAFIAQRHGGDPRVRVLAASLTVFALAGLIMCEALGISTVMKPLLSDDVGMTGLLICVILAVMMLCAMLAGHSGVMYAAQLQLGVLYFGLFGATIFLMYLQVSTLGRLPVRGALAIAYAAAFCIAMPFYRRSRYVDRNVIMTTTPDGQMSESRAAKRLSRFQGILNICISVLAALVIVVAVMEFSSEGVESVARDSIAALGAGTTVPTAGLVALLLLPLFYQVVDVTNWQQLAAFEKDRDPSGGEAGPWSSAVRRVSAAYAFESPLAWLLLCMFGTLAFLSMPAPGAANLMHDFIRGLLAQQNEVATTVLALLLACAVAIAFSTMISQLSAALSAIHYDLVPTLLPGTSQSEPTRAKRATIVAAGALCLLIAVAFFFFDTAVNVSFTSSRFLALVFAFSCAQLALAPLVLGPLMLGQRGDGSRGGPGTVGPGWALGILGAGAAIGIGSIVMFFAVADEAWLWAAVPACLGSGLLLFAVARLRTADAR